MCNTAYVDDPKLYSGEFVFWRSQKEELYCTMEPVAYKTALLEPKLPLKFRLVSTTDTSKVAYVSTIGNVHPRGVIPVIKHSDSMVTVVWGDHMSLTIQHSDVKGGHRYDITWEAVTTKVTSLTDLISLDHACWYGGAEIHNQTWPIQDWSHKVSPYVASDSNTGMYGGVQERYWLSSNGIAIFADYDMPLSVGYGKKQLTLQSKWVTPYTNVDNRRLKLHYTILQGDNAKAAHQMVLDLFISKPENIPDELMFRHPIWSTWARYKKEISQDVVLKFAEEIKDHDFSCCQIDIDDDWTSAYGDMFFNPKKFPDPGYMVRKLNEMGHRVTLWVHPFASPFAKAVKNPQLWVGSKMPTNNNPWWNGVGKSLDVTDDNAVTWFKENLEELRKKYGVTSFKFDAGEVNWLPSMFITKQPMLNPSDYARKYAQLAYDIDREGRCQEVRVGIRTQNLPMFVRMLDKDSVWDYNNGLKTIIPHALTFSILGYPFILPDMIGGNAYANMMGVQLPFMIAGAMKTMPEKELYVRWLQVNVFMPCMQFSISPWQYDDEVVNIARNMVKLHEEYANTMISLAKNCTETGEPIIRPLWWVAPTDEVAQSIDSEFLVGDDILVAPVLDKGATKRNIYLPSGKWRDMIHDQVLDGGQWINDFPADLDELPYFTRE